MGTPRQATEGDLQVAKCDLYARRIYDSGHGMPRARAMSAS